MNLAGEDRGLYQQAYRHSWRVRWVRAYAVLLLGCLV